MTDAPDDFHDDFDRGHARPEATIRSTITATGYVSGPNGIEGPIFTELDDHQQTAPFSGQTLRGTLGFGVSLLQGGTVTNASGGLISGQAGIFIDTPDLNNPAGGSVSNAGRFSPPGRLNLAIYLRTVGQVSNAATGTIEGGWGIENCPYPTRRSTIRA